MSTQLNEEINRAFDLEEAGRFLEAVDIFCKCAQDFPECAEEIRLEIAKMYCRHGEDEEALLQLLQLYGEHGSREVLNLILEVYCDSCREEYDRQYEQNLAQLQKYAHFYGRKPDNEGVRYRPLHMGEQNLWYYDSAEGRFAVARRFQMGMDNLNDKICLSSDVLWMEDILDLEKRTRIREPFMDMENPMLLVYGRETWELLLQIWDLRDLLALDRIVFYEGLDGLQASFLQDEVSVPDTIMLNPHSAAKFGETILGIFRTYEEECARHKKGALEYYRDNGEEILRHIEDGTPKILFLTSRFTTALQYHAKGCKRAADRMGLQTQLLIEKDRLIAGCSNYLCLKTIDTFRPDIIWLLDHFRFEQPFLDGLDNLVVLCWVQDPMSDIMSAASPAKLGKRDILLNHYITWDEFFAVGYDKKKIIDAPIPADSHVYRSYSLSEEEREKYGCDFCFVCHGGDVDGWIEDSLKDAESPAREILRKLYKGYQRWVYETGQCLYGEEAFQTYVKGFLAELGLSICEEVVGIVVKSMHMWLNSAIYRQALVDWLLDAGYTNIKLWGSGWVKVPKYAAYAMGPAENGETLSKIYQASRIVMGNNVHTTAAARAWESMLSGAFYLSNYIPPQEDAVDIRAILKEGEEFVMFRDREDFLQKVEYYLTHEDERLRMLEIGRKAALERMTFDGLIRKALRELPEKLEA